MMQTGENVTLQIHSLDTLRPVRWRALRKRSNTQYESLQPNQLMTDGLLVMLNTEKITCDYIAVLKERILQFEHPYR